MNYLDFIDKKVSFYHRYSNWDILEIPCSGFAPNFKLNIPIEHGISLRDYCEKLATKEEFESLSFD